MGFTRSGETWTQQGGEITGGGQGKDFGAEVALSGDGNTALVGEPYGGGGGAAWVFARSGVTWTQQGGALADGGAELFGRQVALSADGNTALVGGQRSEGKVGTALIFTRAGSAWIQQGGALTGTGEVGGGEFGSGVALSGDGNTALVGGRGDDGEVGAAWVFRRSGATWTQDGEKLTGTGEVVNGFGAEVALSQDGSTALVGGELTQAVWVFVSSSTEAPIDSSPPVISGSAQLGQELSCAPGVWSGDPAPSFSYQWLRDGLSLTGFAGSSYVVQGADEGHTLTCEVTAINSAGKRAATSLGVAVPAGSSSGGGSSAGAGDAGAGAGDAGGGGIISVGREAIASSLARQLTPTQAGGRISSMLRHGGVGLSFSSYKAGMVTVAWYEVPAGARLARKAKPLPVLVAAGSFALGCRSWNVGYQAHARWQGLAQARKARHAHC